MKSALIRQKFLEFFKKNGHTEVASSSLIPAEDPTLLFANAGMNQFKDVFLGIEKRSYTRATSIQKCMRAGGKHNDLDNVGFTKRHLTFFEMMGNFSFGDYFKKDAIRFAWTFLTEELKFDSEKLYASVFQKDDEAYDIWHKEIGLPHSKIVRLGAADNFWQMGDTGPCGPCTEIYVDRGAHLGCGKDSCAVGCNCDRFLEVWNLVFMQFDRQPNGADIPLKHKGVDTGMGLERLAVIMQDKNSVFETDLFQGIIEKIESLSGIKYSEQTDVKKAAFHVLADHIRASSFLIADGCSPSNEGRGYVLRKIIRRAALFTRKLTDKNIFPSLADAVVLEMGQWYPELTVAQEMIKSILTSEIEKFAVNLENGEQILAQYFLDSKADKIITGEQAFKLYDTFGFPFELTSVVARERGYTVDAEGFEQYMVVQRERSGGKLSHEEEHVVIPEGASTVFTGYQQLETSSRISGISANGKSENAVNAGAECWIIVKECPFYVEKGGQVSDQGIVSIKGKQSPILHLRRVENAIAIKIVAPVQCAIGEDVVMTVDKEWRLNTMKNHTATHLLQSALISLFGKQIKQSGSLVHPDYLRFDFTYHKNLTMSEIKQVEDLVNRKIWENIPVSTIETTYKDAVASGVIAFFGEKYNPESVRKVEVTGFSAELCGGTHVVQTGDIGAFKITEVTALSAGQRRIVALTGPKALELFQESYVLLKQLCQEYKVQPNSLFDAIDKHKQEIKSLQNDLKQYKKQQLASLKQELMSQVSEINSVPFLYVDVDGFSTMELRDLVQEMNHKKPGFYVAISNEGDKSACVVAVDAQYQSKIDLKTFGDWLQTTAGIRGGGKKDVLMGGGPRVESSLKDQIADWLRSNK
jgi:alanyl-tRNA synthetase